MNVLVLGSGGREHAISWKLSQSSVLDRLYIAPGNAGTKDLGINLNFGPNDFDAIKETVLERRIEMIVVGPEDPLVNGIVDHFAADPEMQHVAVIGPNKVAAQLEGSKDFAKDFMKRHNVPTAKYKSFTAENIDEADAFLEHLKAPYVLKADGLAAGKGVLIIDDLAEAKSQLRSMIQDQKFGAASQTVVIEEFLSGIELSCFVVTDGDSYKILPEAKDYKRIGEGDTGLNTGGMGCISPVPFATPEFLDKVKNQVIIPTIKGLKKDNIEYKGFLFIGLMKVKGDPYVIEYNVRLGDPETEVILPRLRSDLLDLMEGIATNTLSERDVDIDPRSASTVMLVSGGYPESYEKGKEIKGLQNVWSDDAIIFHAGTQSDGPKTITSGGRVLCATAYGKNLEKALAKSYKAIESISFEKSYYRKDIGKDVL